MKNFLHLSRSNVRQINCIGRMVSKPQMRRNSYNSNQVKYIIITISQGTPQIIDGINNKKRENCLILNFGCYKAS